MSPVQVHLVLNHVPLITVLIGAGLVVFAVARRHDEVLRAGLTLITIAGVATLPVYFSGEPAAETLERVIGVSQHTIEEHEDAAQLAAAAIGMLGLACLAILRRYRGTPAVPVRAGIYVVLATLVVVVLLARAAHLGGHIRHPELAGAVDDLTLPHIRNTRSTTSQ